MQTRRGFLGTTIALAAAAVLVPTRTLFAKARKLAVKLDKAAALKQVGGSATLKLKGRTILFVRDSETSVRAIDAICTHKQCVVEYKRDATQIECPCHASAFGLDGTVKAGPAPKPLQTFPATLQLDKGRVVITVEG